MALSRCGREKYELIVNVGSLPRDYAFLPVPKQGLKLVVTNLRNRPLDPSRVDSLSQVVMSLYHNYITGSRGFPIIPIRGPFCSLLLFTPFRWKWNRENDPHPLLSFPPGMMVPSAGFTSRTIQTAALPERVELGTIGDPRCQVRTLMMDGRTITRVISMVTDTNHSVINNRWRVCDYDENGQCLMSVLCNFKFESGCAERPMNRSHEEKEDRGKESRRPLCIRV
ncbi:uncharacterized protein LOC115779766 isoform X1 [Xyrichtys novacula]|uniref:Uncharacterized protein LOC115779766 isoform X1 n=1 Tax=Xyrichtys novacula TaxID=13765 RepID=A0AAV1GK00_XYRNO|nr:uncharacterized protein LOC115779766 isoform X1 [Xyrichtys novacula]